MKMVKESKPKKESEATSVPLEFLGWDDWTNVNERDVNAEADILNHLADSLTPETELELLLKAISLLDLTSLSGSDTRGQVFQLVNQAYTPVPEDLALKLTNDKRLFSTTAAVCVYPNRVSDAQKARGYHNPPIPIAAVSGGFPSGQSPLPSRVQDVVSCIDQGVDEVDIVLDRSLILTHKWQQLYSELQQMNEAAQGKIVKVILSTGECGSLENIFKASMVAIHAGAHFIKTSTGKETVNATIPVGVVMCRAIKMSCINSNIKIGFKPAGGISTHKDILVWMLLIIRELGASWLTPKHFRIGASSVLKSIVERLKELDAIVTSSLKASKSE